MTRTLAISDTGLRLIKAFEGFRPDDRTLVTGTRVVGYGHRLESHDDPVHLSRADAEEQLLDDLEPIEEIVNDEVHAPLTQGQFDALCSLAFNIGSDAFRASDIVRAMNNGRVLDAANGFDVWRMATVNGQTYVVDALMRRRTAEKSLFLRHEPAVPAPSAMLQPQPDGMAPFGPTDDGLPKATISDASGVIDAANIINAERVDPVDPVDTSVGILTLSNLADSGEDDDDVFDDTLDDDDFLDDDGIDEAIIDEDLVDEDLFEETDDDDLDDDFANEDDLDDEALLDDDTVDENLDDEDQDEGDLDPDDEDDADLDDDGDDVAGYDDDLLDDDDALDDPIDEDEDDKDRLDLSALIAPAASTLIAQDLSDNTPTDTTDEAPIEPETHLQDAANPSVITSAATSLGDRLSALLDSDDTETSVEPLEALPASLFEPTQIEGQNDTDTETDIEIDAGLVLTQTDESTRSNLVSFPKRELVLDDPIETDLVDTPLETSGMMVIDDLAADDVIRASRDPENPIFDPEGDPVENAMRYLERQASEKQAKKSNGGMWIPIALGATLVGASAVLIGRGATQMLSAWGPTAVTAAAITGGLTVLFAIYIAARGRSA